ncbi:N-formylglutamate amidohydrolase [Cognatishimia sp. WU-CL00825]|uniref:N-formylglutamate amidohydrolase n=1 Tax=Cognatishimia sp. WU-CL00825 TaxID=3127658 RepID=UPI0031030E0E
MVHEAFKIFGAERPGRWLITADHATNLVPSEINNGDLGLSAQDMQRHIAYDIGALGVSLKLGELLDSPVVCSNFSRLVIDPNRGRNDPTLVMRLYDGTIVPANADIDEAEEARRIDAYYAPYHAALDEMTNTRQDPVIVAMHSFSPKLNGRKPRPWEIGILHAAHDTRNFGKHFIARLQQEPDLTVGDNEPYAGHLPGDTIDRLALQNGRLNTLIELRQDLITSEKDQHDWAIRLAPMLQDALNQSGY